MTDYRFHWWPSVSDQSTTPHVTLEAESRLHGAALALRQFVKLGCDVAAPAAHLDLTEADGVKHTLLVEEVLDWLKDPKQAAFAEREQLESLLRTPSE